MSLYANFVVIWMLFWLLKPYVRNLIKIYYKPRRLRPMLLRFRFTNTSLRNVWMHISGDCLQWESSSDISFTVCALYHLVISVILDCSAVKPLLLGNLCLFLICNVSVFLVTSLFLPHQNKSRDFLVFVIQIGTFKNHWRVLGFFLFFYLNRGNDSNKYISGTLQICKSRPKN